MEYDIGEMVYVDGYEGECRIEDYDPDHAEYLLVDEFDTELGWFEECELKAIN